EIRGAFECRHGGTIHFCRGTSQLRREVTNLMQYPRLVIAGTQSGVGKTTATLALLAAFAARGRRVQAFKIGPDFIDPGHHAAVTGRPSRNLAGWMHGPT